MNSSHTTATTNSGSVTPSRTRCMKPTVPNLNVAGWWDQEDFYGPMMTYANLEKSDTEKSTTSWSSARGTTADGRTARAIRWARFRFDSDTGVYFRQKIEAPWFAYWLNDKGTLPLKEATTFQTGSDTWTSYDSWPPKEAQTKISISAKTEAFLRCADNRRERRISTVTSAIPRIPCPTATARSTSPIRSDHPGSWYTWLVQDQRFVDDRPDVLTWQTGTLEEDVTVAGT